MSDQSEKKRVIRIEDIQVAEMSAIDRKISLGTHRFRSKKTAEKYLENLLHTALHDAWKSGEEFGGTGFMGAAYIQGCYSARIENTVAEMTRLEINESLRKIRK
ncbi:hypothetical protein [Acetobacter persici]|uniref:Uncharacterized protein n=1 Tax=Acetobacter persici TaxID=1076596 RepID=A0A6V8IB35_9PROT|nr:hypothetical protein [Acetobacter persici]GFE94839.1 hypothetical protein DmAi_28980 [Acetobacter persici]